LAAGAAAAVVDWVEELALLLLEPQPAITAASAAASAGT
jgi:hypothetical protein